MEVDFLELSSFQVRVSSFHFSDIEKTTATAKFTIRTVLERMKKMERRDEKQDRLHDISRPLQRQQDTKMTFNKLDIAMKQCFEIKKQQILALKTPPKLGYFYTHLRSQKKKKNYLC